MAIKYKALVIEFRYGSRKKNEEILREKFGCKIIDSDQLRGYLVFVPVDKTEELKEYKRLASVEDFDYPSSKKFF